MRISQLVARCENAAIAATKRAMPIAKSYARSTACAAATATHKARVVSANALAAAASKVAP